VIRTTIIVCVSLISLVTYVSLTSAEEAANPIATDKIPSAKITPPVVTNAQVAGDNHQTRFIVALDRKTEFAVFTLANPYRVVIDLPQVVFKLPNQAGDRGRGLVKAFRFGLMMPGGSRIVLDTTGPVRVDTAFVLNATEAQPARLVINLLPSDRESFLRDMVLESRPSRTTARHMETMREDEADPRPLIVLDPGHGGIDNGTRGLDGQNEKDVVLAFAKTLQDQLLSVGKYRVAMTRSEDVFVPLNERVRSARNRKAALFISIHADAVPRREGQAEGATVYTLSEEASDAEAAAIAEAENKSDALAGIDLASEPNDVANILVDLAQRETKTFSLQFARSLVGELKKAARLHKHPLKSAGFVVLKAPDVPSVLVELGYMSTRDDLKLLTSSEWQGRTAAAVVGAVNTYLGPRLAGTSGKAH
jgi:N-acetylmuramoyl-L-alanine amidase